MNKKKLRKRCLKCGVMFPPQSKGNRICPTCKIENKNMSIRSEGVLDL